MIASKEEDASRRERQDVQQKKVVRNATMRSWPTTAKQAARLMGDIVVFASQNKENGVSEDDAS